MNTVRDAVKSVVKDFLNKNKTFSSGDVVEKVNAIGTWTWKEISDELKKVSSEFLYGNRFKVNGNIVFHAPYSLTVDYNPPFNAPNGVNIYHPSARTIAGYVYPKIKTPATKPTHSVALGGQSSNNFSVSASQNFSGGKTTYKVVVQSTLVGQPLVDEIVNFVEDYFDGLSIDDIDELVVKGATFGEVVHDTDVKAAILNVFPDKKVVKTPVLTAKPTLQQVKASLNNDAKLPNNGKSVILTVNKDGRVRIPADIVDICLGSKIKRPIMVSTTDVSNCVKVTV